MKRHTPITAPESDTVRVAVWFTITRDEYEQGWEHPADANMANGDDTLHPTEELAESIIARLDEFYGDDGGAYQPTIQNVNVSVDGSTYAYNPAERNVR